MRNSGPGRCGPADPDNPNRTRFLPWSRNPHATRFAIDIDDDGDAVPEALRERLFLPLVTGRDQGSGFGLAVVSRLPVPTVGVVEYLPTAWR